MTADVSTPLREETSWTTDSHAQCRNELLDRMAASGIEITVSTEKPIVLGPYTTDGFTCPHGTTFWIEPTGEQIAQWQRDGTP